MTKIGGYHRDRKISAVLKVIPHCPVCGKVGQVTSKRSDGTLGLVCNDCKTGWDSLTEVCPVCGDGNGYAVPGLCKKCYEHRRGVA